MKEYKTFNQQLTILRNRGLIVPTDGKPKRFLEQENYYNVINGYKDLFLLKDTHGKPVEPEYSYAAEPPVQFRLSHLSRRSEPL